MGLFEALGVIGAGAVGPALPLVSAGFYASTAKSRCAIRTNTFPARVPLACSGIFRGDVAGSYSLSCKDLVKFLTNPLPARHLSAKVQELHTALEIQLQEKTDLSLQLVRTSDSSATFVWPAQH